jgi:hypothetical protein
MNSERFLAGLLEDGVVISVSGGKVRLRDTQGVLTQGLRAELAERKEEILALLRDQHEYAATSFAQNRLWFLDQLVPQAAFYNMPFALRLEGKLNVITLKESLNEIVRRHEALRTTFVTIDGRPFQEIAFQWALELPVIDLRSLGPEEREARTRQLALEEAERPFDLSTGPVIRSVLLWLDREEYVLLLTKHHIVSDGWSLGVFVKELGALYEAFSKGCPSPLPELPIQYADFALWRGNAYPHSEGTARLLETGARRRAGYFGHADRSPATFYSNLSGRLSPALAAREADKGPARAE